MVELASHRGRRAMRNGEETPLDHPPLIPPHPLNFCGQGRPSISMNIPPGVISVPHAPKPKHGIILVPPLNLTPPK